MAFRNSNLPVWRYTNAWREIFARIFEDVETTLNLSPEWLVNPATNRRLKLDMLYPKIGVAVRFEGLQGKNRRQRPSLEEEIQQRTRDNARVEMCRNHGIELIVVDTTSEDPKPLFQAIELGLSRAGEQAHTLKLQQVLRRARTTASTIARRVKTNNDLATYADLWDDRQYRLAEPTPVAAAPPQTAKFKAGMEVEHSTFGPGVVIAIAARDEDTFVTVDFLTAGQKTLAASLVGDKLAPR
jgi:hypothetical protein